MATPESTATTRSSEGDTTIDVVLPARAELAATLRLVVASLGADVGLTVDEIDDVRLAVDEVFTSVADHSPTARFRASFTPREQSLSITMCAIDAGTLRLDDLARTILDAVADDLTIDDDSVTIEKHAHEASD